MLTIKVIDIHPLGTMCVAVMRNLKAFYLNNLKEKSSGELLISLT